LANEIGGKDRAKIELEDLRIELRLQEDEERWKQREMEEFQKRIRHRLEMISDYHAQLEEKRQRLQKEWEDEEKFRVRVRTKIRHTIPNIIAHR
jgi:hypothetical protein